MERSSNAAVFVGIDVAKDRLDVHLRPTAEAFAIGRNAAGLAALVERLTAAPARQGGPELVRRRDLDTVGEVLK